MLFLFRSKATRHEIAKKCNATSWHRQRAVHKKATAGGAQELSAAAAAARPEHSCASEGEESLFGNNAQLNP